MAYKTPRAEARVYFLPEQHQHLKAIAEEKGISLSELISTTVLKKYPISKKGREKKPAQWVACTQSPEDTATKEQRLAEINRRLEQAKQGDHLPKHEYFALCDERKSLQLELGHN